MIFYFNANGEPLGMKPERVFQGSKNATEITFIGAVPAENQVSASFEYEEGQKVERVVLEHDTGFGAINLQDEFGNGYTAWTCSLPSTVTAKKGAVSVQFYIYNPSGQIVSTATNTFSVEDGVDGIEPEKTDTYDKVLTMLSQIKAQLDSAGGGSGGGGSASLYKYTFSGEFMDYSSETQFEMRNITFISHRNDELTSDNLFDALKNALKITGGEIDEKDGEEYGRFVPVCVGTGNGINAILLLDQSNLMVSYRIFEAVNLYDYTVEVA